MPDNIEEAEVLIFGAGGHASKLVEVARRQGLQVLGYISTEAPGSIINRAPVLGDIEYFKAAGKFHNRPAHIAIGEVSVRYDIFQKIDKLARIVSLISTENSVSEGAEIGAGASILQNVTVQPGVKIGKSCIIDTGAIIEHDVIIGDFVNLSPGAILCGHVKVGDGAIIGAGATVIERVAIGKNALIGAGSVVIGDVADNCVAAGNPARVISQRKFSDHYLKGASKTKDR